MGFKNPNVVKTIVLPVPDGIKTEKEYFDEYGINIRDLFAYDEERGSIIFKERTSIYFLYNEGGFGFDIDYPSIFPVIMYEYETTETEAITRLGALSSVETTEGGVVLVISYGLGIVYSKEDNTFTLSYYEK